MKWLTIAVLGVALRSVLSVDGAQAQPILDRVEQLLRNQLGGARPAAPAAAEPGYLGLIAEDTAGQGGVRVVQIVPDGPAARGGIRVGDLITSIDAQPIRSMDDLARALQGKTEGTALSMALRRSDAAQSARVTLGRRNAVRPAQAAVELPAPSAIESPAPRGPRLGVRTLPVTEEARRANGLPDASGAMINFVAVGGPAERAGIPQGAVITAIDDRPVRSPQDLVAAIQQTTKGEVELTYFAGGQELHKRVALFATARPNDGPSLELRGKPAVVATPSEVPTPPSSGDERAAALERRIRELEQRVEKLEAASASPAR